jgi:hypothetical protein
MQLLDRSLTASIYSLGQGGCSTSEALLPSDALVIVIQDRPQVTAGLPVVQWPTYHLSVCESLPVSRREAGKAYSEQPRNEISIINVSG